MDSAVPHLWVSALWVLLRQPGWDPVNRIAVYRVLKAESWFVYQRVTKLGGCRAGGESGESEQRTVEAHGCDTPFCGQDGWAHLAAVIDCRDREVIGYEFALRSRAARPPWKPPCLASVWDAAARESWWCWSDNGLIFQSRRFRQACRDIG